MPIKTINGIKYKPLVIPRAEAKQVTKLAFDKVKWKVYNQFKLECDKEVEDALAYSYERIVKDVKEDLWEHALAIGPEVFLMKREKAFSTDQILSYVRPPKRDTNPYLDGVQAAFELLFHEAKHQSALEDNKRK